MYSRPFPQTLSLSVMAIASGATSLAAPTNAGRGELRLQADGAFWVGVASGMPSAVTGMPGLFVATGNQFGPVSHGGAVYAFSGLANGATVALRIWETSV